MNSKSIGPWKRMSQCLKCSAIYGLSDDIFISSAEHLFLSKNKLIDPAERINE